MYQAWAVQEINGERYNVVFGRDFKTKKDAYKRYETYTKYLGKCGDLIIEPAGTEIPLATVKRETLKEKILSWFR